MFKVYLIDDDLVILYVFVDFMEFVNLFYVVFNSLFSFF